MIDLEKKKEHISLQPLHIESMELSHMGPW